MAIWTRSPEESTLAAENAHLQARVAALEALFGRLDSDNDRLVAALRSSGATVVIHDETGREMFSSIGAFVDHHQGDSVAMGHLIAAALFRAADEPIVERYDLIGPPARSVQVRATRIDGPSGPIGAMAVLDDITEATRLELLRRDLVVNVGHELRTPVGALGVLAETLVLEIEQPDGDREAVLRMARRMEIETFRLAELVNDVLELATAQDVLPGVVRVVDIVDQAVGRVSAAADIAGIEVSVDPIDPSVTVPGERPKLVSVVFNLLDNAIKYSDNGTVVRVTVRNDRANVWVDVIDQGLGIAPRDRARVFDRYFRVDRARARATGGSGLGLAIVLEIVSAHGGEVTLRSVEGHGSTFTVQLPAASATPASSGDTEVITP